MEQDNQDLGKQTLNQNSDQVTNNSAQEQQVQQQPLQNQVKPKIKPKKISSILFVIFSILFLLLAGYFYFQRTIFQQRLQSPLKITDQTRLIIPKPTSLPTYLENDDVDLSYIFIHADEAVNILVTSPEASRSGVNKNGAEFSEIDDAYLSLELPLANDVTGETYGDKYWEFLYPDPISGVYKIEFTTNVDGLHDFEILVYNRNAEAEVFEESFDFKTGSSIRYQLEYDKNKTEGFASLERINN